MDGWIKKTFIKGRFTYRSPEVLGHLIRNELVGIQYVDVNGDPTMLYPWNPNGSELGVAAICSDNGRHLAMMPHSDRSVYIILVCLITRL